jgi:hypothetical protein
VTDGLTSLLDLFGQGGPVMILIAGVSVLAWFLALRTWWTSRYPLAWLERAQAGAPADLRERFLIAAQSARLEQTAWLVAASAIVLPLLGLLGTVLGMLASFEVIQVHGTGQPRLLAGGIGQALLTTQAGLLTAVPVLFFHHVIRNRIRLIRNEMELLSHADRTGNGKAGG